ncbi:MAG TPA: EamA family transporter [Eggerthellaceae bacterium]|nr:EamA family transporter [Eggerthellaceae bacterium]
MLRYRLLIIVATIIWGSSFVIVKDVTGMLSPAWILVVRFAAAAVIMAIALLPRRQLYFDRAHVGYGLLFGVAMFLAYYLQTIGITDTTPGKNAFLTGTYCVMVPFLAWAGLRRRPNRYNIVAAALCIVGIGFISLDGNLGIGFGDAMTLGCAVFYALHIVLVSHFAQNRDIFVLTMWQFAGVAACSLVAGIAFEPSPDLAALPFECWASLAYLTLACTALALLLQNIGQAHLPPASAALLLSLESVFGVAFSVALGAESLSARVVAGFALVFAAIVVSEVLPQRAQARASMVE